jgi:hypothetical protein
LVRPDRISSPMTSRAAVTDSLAPDDWLLMMLPVRPEARAGR